MDAVKEEIEETLTEMDVPNTIAAVKTLTTDFKNHLLKFKQM